MILDFETFEKLFSFNAPVTMEILSNIVHEHDKNYDDFNKLARDITVPREKLYLPFQNFIELITNNLIILGVQGFESLIRKKESHLVKRIIHRGLISDDIFLKMVPVLGMYIILFWKVFDNFYSDSKVLNEIKLFKVSKNKDIFNTIPPMENNEYEWEWIHRIAWIANELGIQILNIIPEYLQKVNIIEKENINSIWRKKHESQIINSNSYLYTFKLCKFDDVYFTISISQRYSEPMTFYGLICEAFIDLAQFEEKIRTCMQEIITQWEKMRASDNLHVSNVDEELINNLLCWTKKEPQVFLKDNKMSTTAMRATVIRQFYNTQDESSLKDKSNNLRHLYEKLFKEAQGYTAGNIGRVKKEIDDDTKKEIKTLVPDLKNIYHEVWPTKSIDGEIDKEKIFKLIQSEEITKLKKNHFNFNWEKVKQNEPRDLLAKIVAEYLQDTKGIRYEINSIKSVLKDLLNLSKL